MANAVSVSEEILTNKIKAARKAVKDARTLVEMQSDISHDVKEDSEDLPLPGSGTSRHKVQKNYISKMEETVSVSDAILANEIKVLDHAKKTVANAKILFEMQSNILLDAKEDSEEFQLPRTSTPCDQMQENTLSKMEEVVSISETILANKIKVLDRAKKAIADAKTLLEMQPNILYDAKRDVQ